MIQVTYLDHSGFAITTEKAVLVFDYYKDPAHALRKILDGNKELPVLFFVGHHHSDHYAPQIYDLAQDHKRVYVLSNDVDGDRIPAKDKLSIANMSAGDVIDNLPGGISVKAFGSTDAAVSFAVTLADGKTIFHAGDLNDWHWKNESTQAEIDKAERHFTTILNRIASEEKEFYVAMFPVDERQGTDFSRGATLFTDKVKDKIAYNISKSRYFMDKELFKKLNDDIWEFRTIYQGFKYRLLAFWDKDTGNLVIATHGFVKKTQKTPESEIAHAEALRKNYYKKR